MRPVFCGSTNEYAIDLQSANAVAPITATTVRTASRRALRKSESFFWVRGPAMRLIKRLLQVFGVLAGFMFLFELSARISFPNQIQLWRDPFGSTALYFVSPGALANRAGFPTYASQSKVRIAVYYPDPQGVPTVEYDCSYNSDENGFVSNEIKFEKSEVLLLGDSFIVGQGGGCQWVSRLKSSIRSKLYIAAHGGWGVLHWELAIKYLEQAKPIDKMLIVFITHDFFRPDWLYSQQQLDCLRFQTGCEGQWAHPIVDNLFDKANERSVKATEAHRSFGIRARIRHHLIATYTLVNILLGRSKGDLETLNRSVAAVSSLASRYRLKLLWVNERREALFPLHETRMLEEKLSGLDVTRCRIPTEGFLPRDPHPNALGFYLLKTCVEELLEAW